MMEQPMSHFKMEKYNLAPTPFSMILDLKDLNKDANDSLSDDSPHRELIGFCP